MHMYKTPLLALVLLLIAVAFAVAQPEEQPLPSNAATEQAERDLRDDHYDAKRRAAREAGDELEAQRWVAMGRLVDSIVSTREAFEQYQARIDQLEAALVVKRGRLDLVSRGLDAVDPAGPLQVVKVESGQTIENQVYRDTVLEVRGQQGVTIRNVTIYNGAVRVWSSEGVLVEDVWVVGGHPEDRVSQAAFAVSAVKGVTLQDCQAHDSQRGLYVTTDTFVGTVRGSTDELLVDGLLIDGYRNWLDTVNRQEPILLHGYGRSADYTIASTVMRDVVIRDRPSGMVTLWDLWIKGIVLESVCGSSGINLGFSGFIRPCESLVVRDVDGDRLNYRLYDLPLPATAIGQIDLPEGWRHVVQRGGGNNVRTLGEYATVQGVIDNHTEAGE